MQYIRRRILRVSGVTVRDEHLERRDFSGIPLREGWEDLGDPTRDGTAPERASIFRKDSGDYRERT